MREFGENLNDTFVFIRQNFKSLLGPFFAICGVFMLAQAVFNGMYQSTVFSGIFDQLFNGRPSYSAGTQPFEHVFNGTYFLMILFTVLTFVAMPVTLGAYIKFYVENDGAQPTLEQVWALFKKYFFKMFLYSIPLYLLVVIGFVFCIAPGVWLAVTLAPFTLVVMIEDQNFSGAFYRCIDIVKDNFWISFGIYLVAGIIYKFSSGIVSVVVGLIAGVLTYFSTRSVGTTAGIVTSFLNIFSFVFYIIFFVSLALHYFNLVERRDGTGILNRIDTIGSTDDKPAAGEEY